LDRKVRPLPGQAAEADEEAAEARQLRRNPDNGSNRPVMAARCVRMAKEISESSRFPAAA
jgi:hypothetical protein